VDMYVTHVGRG